MRVSRGLLTTTLFLAGLTAAQAADYLRGAISSPQVYQGGTQSSQSFDWSGFHFGGVGTYSLADVKIGSSTQAIASAAYPNLSVTDQIGSLIHLNDFSRRKGGFAVFGGYSMMWDDVVIGAEAEYGRTNIAGVSNIEPISRRLTSSDTGGLFDVYVSSGARQVKMNDYGVIRGRVGAAYGQFLPFLTFGIAMGRVQTTTTVQGSVQNVEIQAVTDPITGDVTGYNRIVLGSTTANYRSTKTNLKGGYALGAGLDVALMQNVFLRGQWEYINIGSTKSGSVSMHTFKGGAAVKF